MYVNKLHTHTHAYTQRYVCVWPRPNPLASVSQATETRVNCVPSHDAAPDRLAPVNFLHQDEAGSRLSAAAARGQRLIDLRPHAARAIHSSAETCVCVCVCRIQIASEYRGTSAGTQECAGVAHLLASCVLDLHLQYQHTPGTHSLLSLLDSCGSYEKAYVEPLDVLRQVGRLSCCRLDVLAPLCSGTRALERSARLTASRSRCSCSTAASEAAIASSRCL